MKDSDKPAYIHDPDALVYAAYDGDYEFVVKLLSQGADINVRNENGETALMRASDEGYIGIVEFLLGKGADPNVIDKEEDTALDIARFKEHDDIIKILLTHGATGKNGLSARQRNWDEINDAMEDVNKFRDGTYYGEQLIDAARDGDVNRCKEILERPVETSGLILLRYLGKDSQDNSALHLAAKNGHLDVVKLLLENGMGPEGRNNIGKTPADLAKESGYQHIIHIIEANWNKKKPVNDEE